MQNSQVSERIKLMCKENRIPISVLINECNLTKSLIYDMEKRDKTPSVDKVEKIADYFNVSIDYLVGRTDIPDNPNLKAKEECLV